MEPRKIYDYLVLVRQRMFDQVRALSPEQYAQRFPIGLGTLGRTLAHVVSSEWYYVQRMTGRDVPAYETWPIRAEDPPPFAALEAAWIKQADDTRGALGATRDAWHEPIEYLVTADDGRRMIVTASPADQFTQLVLHEVHHRAQAVNMLRHLGAGSLGDLDFNALMFPRRDAE
jgi:uncharacterized damage-inducible protein DinB